MENKTNHVALGTENQDTVGTAIFLKGFRKGLVLQSNYQASSWCMWFEECQTVSEQTTDFAVDSADNRR